MSLNSMIRGRLLEQLASPSPQEQDQLNDALRLLSKWRSVLLQNTLLQQNGTVVLQGPLQGLNFIRESAEGCHVPKLLGCYEQPLQPHIERAIEASYPLVINIGCAEGYYAVGMARRMPETEILAFDINAKAQQACAELAEMNSVAARVTVGALFQPEDFAAYEGQRALVLCDIEGGERDLLNPARSPALAGMDIIVESHDCLLPGLSRMLIERFSPTHDVLLVEDDGQRSLPAAPSWFRSLSHLDQLLATWEWRSGPTPWLVMKPRVA